MHLFNVILVSLVIYSIYYLSTKNILLVAKNTFVTVQGAIFSTFIYINSRHIGNILTFKAIDENPNLLSGKIKQSYLFALRLSQIDAYGASIILFFVFIFMPSYFTFGFMIGPLITAFKHKAWVRKYLKDKKRKGNQK